jgi:hypothetical protein
VSDDHPIPMKLVDAILAIGYDPDSLLKMDGFDDCVIGITMRCGEPPVLCYDRNAVIMKLHEQQGMAYYEAEQYFIFNQLGSYVGDHTPTFIEFIDEDAE